MATKPYPLRIPDNLLTVIDAKAREDRTDRATVLRQLLYAGAEGYVLALLAEGRLSLSKAAELLDMSTLRVVDLARDRGLQISADVEDDRRGA